MKVKREHLLEMLYEDGSLNFTLDVWEEVRNIFIPLKHKEVRIYPPVMSDDGTGGEIRVELIKRPQDYIKKVKIEVLEEL